MPLLTVNLDRDALVLTVPPQAGPVTIRLTAWLDASRLGQQHVRGSVEAPLCVDIGRSPKRPLRAGGDGRRLAGLLRKAGS